MKVIDLLNKIANGEEVPEKFRFAGQIFEKQGSYIEDEDGDSIFDSMCIDFSNINEEVEIIEEDKKIENIKDLNTDYYDKNETYDYLGNKEIVLDILTLKHKINEIIDKVNKGE